MSDEFIVNPQTGRRVRRDGAVGRRILASQTQPTTESIQPVTTSNQHVKKRRRTLTQSSPSLVPPPIKEISLPGVKCMIYTLLLNKQEKWRGYPLRLCIDGINSIKSALADLHPELAPTIKKTCLVILGCILLLHRRVK